MAAPPFYLTYWDNENKDIYSYLLNEISLTDNCFCFFFSEELNLSNYCITHRP